MSTELPSAQGEKSSENETSSPTTDANEEEKLTDKIENENAEVLESVLPHDQAEKILNLVESGQEDSVDKVLEEQNSEEPMEEESMPPLQEKSSEDSLKEFIPEALEITVPAELLGEDQCKLCKVSFLGPDTAQQHYQGKKHAQKENQYVRKVYEEKGIDPTRFLHKPGSMREPKTKDEKKASSGDFGVEASQIPSLDPDKYKFSCFLCGVHFVAYEHVELHVKTSMHAMRVWEFQSCGYDESLLRPPGPWSRSRNLAQNWPQDFKCKICEKELNSPQQWEQHIQSKNHQRKIKNLMETGDPRGLPVGYTPKKRPADAWAPVGGSYDWDAADSYDATSPEFYNDNYGGGQWGGAPKLRRGAGGRPWRGGRMGTGGGPRPQRPPWSGSYPPRPPGYSGGGTSWQQEAFWDQGDAW